MDEFIEGFFTMGDFLFETFIAILDVHLSSHSRNYLVPPCALCMKSFSARTQGRVESWRSG